MLALRDDERAEIARELHEDIAQKLISAMLELAALRDTIKHDDQAEKLLIHSAELIKNSTDRIRQISYDFSPPLLHEIGLAAVLPWYVDRVCKRLGFRVGLDIETTTYRLSRMVQTTLFRIIEDFIAALAPHQYTGHAQIKISIARPEIVRMTLVSRFESQGKKVINRELPAIVSVRERVAKFGGEVHMRLSDRLSIAICLPTSIKNSASTA